MFELLHLALGALLRLDSFGDRLFDFLRLEGRFRSLHRKRILLLAEYLRFRVDLLLIGQDFAARPIVTERDRAEPLRQVDVPVKLVSLLDRARMDLPQYDRRRLARHI